MKRNKIIGGLIITLSIIGYTQSEAYADILKMFKNDDYITDAIGQLIGLSIIPLLGIVIFFTKKPLFSKKSK